MENKTKSKFGAFFCLLGVLFVLWGFWNPHVRLVLFIMSGISFVLAWLFAWRMEDDGVIVKVDNFEVGDIKSKVVGGFD